MSDTSPLARRSGGLLRPMMSMLQRRAFTVILYALVVFHIGIGWVIYRLVQAIPADVRGAYLASAEVRTTLAIGVAWILGLIVFACFMVLRLIGRHVTQPVAELARLSEAVASGELSIPFKPSNANNELGRLSRATAGMISNLRQLAGTLGASAKDTSSLSSQITTASESVAAAAQQTAATSNSLSRESRQMAQTIREIAGEAAQLVEISGSLRERAEEGLRRERRLRALAQENRTRLDESSRALEVLTTEAWAAAESIESLASAVDEIRAFLTLVQKISRQSKLLALNAAMEAARAGEQGEGFAVVANEVRRLAANSADAAHRTDILAKSMLERVEHSRETAKKTLTTVNSVLDATQHGRRSFVQVEQGVIQAEEWSSAIEQAVVETSRLVVEMTDRLENLAQSTQSFATAMHQVATASEEQSSSIDQIAGAASTLTSTATRVAELVGTFKLGDAGSNGGGSDEFPVRRKTPRGMPRVR